MIQRDPHLARQEQKTQAMTTLMVLALVLFLVQLWLITIALESYMAADTRLALPTFLASGFCFLLNLWLLRYLYGIDRAED